MNYKTSTNYLKVNKRLNNHFNQNKYSGFSSVGRFFNKNLMNNDPKRKSLYDGFDNVLCKELSKKKYRGVLDVSSVGNKDVLTDSDSEAPRNRNSKENEDYNVNDNYMPKKKGCAKLIIEKIESQIPQTNAEYYKFTNQKRSYDNYKNMLNSKYINNRVIRINSNKTFNRNNNRYFNNLKDNYMIQSVEYNDQSQPVIRQYMDKRPYINNYNKVNTNPNYKKSNYSVNRVLTTEASTKYAYNNERSRDNLGNTIFYNEYIVPSKNYYHEGKSPYLKNNTENSFDKYSNSFNFQNIPSSRIKKHFFEENDFSNPVFSNNEEVYPKVRTMGLKKNLDLRNVPQKKTISLYGNYKNSVSNPKLGKLMEYKCNTKSNKTYLINRFGDKLVKSIIKIQSFWRGAFIRELMIFFWNLNKYRDILRTIILNHIKKDFYYLINELKNGPKEQKSPIILKPGTRPRYIYKKKGEGNNSTDSNQDKLKDENYNKLLENYNSLMDKYNKLKDEKNIKNKKFVELNVDSNNFGIIYKKKKLNAIKNDNTEKNKIKKFDIIKPEQKEVFNIIHNRNSIKHKKKKKSKKSSKSIEPETIEEKSDTKNNDKDNYEDYLNHFKSNINITNNNQFFIEKSRNNIQPKIESKTFDNISINKNGNNEITILNSKKKPELIKESQTNLNTEIKGPENNKLKKIVKNFIVSENNINIIQMKKKNKSKKLDKKNKKENKSQNNNTNNFKNDTLEIINDIKLSVIDDIKEKEKENKNNDIIDNNDTDTNKELSKLKNEDKNLPSEEKDKTTKFEGQIMIDNNNILLIKGNKKRKCDKITEITEELNKIEPNNHYELIYEGINLNEKLENLLNEKNDNINNIKDNENNINEKKNIYENNEVEKGEALEINPIEMKKTKNNINNIFISYENKMEVLNSKEAIFTEKAKRNLMKIILPIRLKTTLREYVRKNTFPLLISNLKKIAISMNNNKNNKNNDIKNLLINYAVYKWNKSLFELSKNLIDSKSSTTKKSKRRKHKK